MAVEHSDPESGELAAILPSLGTEVRILHPLRGQERALGGGDLDCAVERLDMLWPLRLPGGWRLLQCVHYEFRGWTWILEHEGSVMELDTLCDPDGIGHHGFPTGVAISASPQSLDAIRAAYLTSKRLRKAMRARPDWDHIASLAQTDTHSYLSTMKDMFGKRVATQLADVVERREPPSEWLSREANLALWRRRLRTPLRVLSLAGGTLARAIERTREPTGLHVVVAGPDGAGKSTLAAALIETCMQPFQRSSRFHWRPGVLPRLGALVRAPLRDITLPHGRRPHGAFTSLAALGYYWADFFIGYLTRVAVPRIRGGLIVVERGWWDMSIDPRRYRISTPTTVVRALGHLLPRADLSLVLEAPRRALLARKQELTEAELDRQTRAWREILPRSPRVFLDASRSEQEVSDAAREQIFSLLEERTLSRLGRGWVGLPSRGRPRWLIPRGPTSVTRAALSIYQPMTPIGRVGWEAARVAASIGAFRILTRGPAPPKAVGEALAPHLPPGSTVAVARANHPGRYIAFVIGDSGKVRAVAKVATDSVGRMALDKEGLALADIGRMLPEPLKAPKVLDRSPGLLLLEPIPWSPRRRTHELPEEVALGLGVFFRTTSGGASTKGAAHGDCAPWNLLRSGAGWALVDWEEARADGPPFFDIFHYLAQAHILIKRRGARDLLNVLINRKAPGGRAIEAFALGAGIPAHEAIGSLPAYLEVSAKRINPLTPSGRAGLRVRKELLLTLGRSSG